MKRHIWKNHTITSHCISKTSQAKWFSDNISLIQSQHIYIHSGFKPIIVSVRSNSLKVIALGPHTKEKLFCWVWVLFHLVVCTVYVLFFLMSFFVSVIFFFVGPPPAHKYSATYSSKSGGCFQKSSIFTWSQKSNTLHKLPKTSTV